MEDCCKELINKVKELEQLERERFIAIKALEKKVYALEETVKELRQWKTKYIGHQR